MLITLAQSNVIDPKLYLGLVQGLRAMSPTVFPVAIGRRYHPCVNCLMIGASKYRLLQQTRPTAVRIRIESAPPWRLY